MLPAEQQHASENGAGRVSSPSNRQPWLLPVGMCQPALIAKLRCRNGSPHDLPVVTIMERSDLRRFRPRLTLHRHQHQPPLRQVS